MSGDRPPRGPDEHKAAARELGLERIQDLLVLDRTKDPYYKGTPAHWRDARWFAGLWEQYGYTTGVHLRRVHYRLFTTRGQTATGETYENTDQHWNELNNGATAARALGLLDPEAFVDRRNDPPRLHVSPRWELPAPSWQWRDAPPWERPAWELPAVERWALDVDDWELPAIRPWRLGTGAPYRFAWPDPDVDGYDYDPDDQPVLLEVWIEKSTMDDLLAPLCRELHINLQVGAGFASITAAIALLRRAERHGKPAHVLYVADFDPAGAAMPVAVARQAQFWREQLGIQAELTIGQVALTAGQADAYQLPRAPVRVDKNGVADPRGKRFEERNGEGVVELDALEALHPGALAETVRHAAQSYIDATLPPRLAGAERQAASDTASARAEATAPLDEQLAAVEADVETVTDAYGVRLRALDDELREVLAPYQERLDRLRADVHDVLAPFREQLAVLADELADELASRRERLDELAEQAAATIDEFDPELPDRPGPVVPDVDRDGLLYDSARHWRDQLQAFKARQSGTDD